MKILFLISLCVFLSSCVRAIYVVESSTVLENESAGEWPDFEKTMLKKLKKEGPAFYEKGDSSLRRKRALNNINGELIRHE